jgi:hypothetical protein
MTLAWLLIDALGRRKLLILGSMLLAVSFLILTVFGGLSENSSKIDIPVIVPGILGSLTLFIATGKKDMSLVELSLICIQVPSVSGGWQRSG